jgi:RNA polymerase sigma factor (sigma-70 family)
MNALRIKRHLDADQQRLAESVVRYAERIADRWAAKVWSHREDIHSAAQWGACQAAATFDPSKGVPFRIHAQRRIVGAIRDALREVAPRGFRRKSGDAPNVVFMHSTAVGDDNGKPRELAKTLASEDASPDEGEKSADAVRGLLKGLPRLHRVVMERFYLNAATQTMFAVAQSLGISESRVSQLHSQAIGMIREKIESDGAVGREGADQKKPGRPRVHDHNLILRLAAEHQSLSKAKLAALYEAETGRSINRNLVAHVVGTSSDKPTNGASVKPAPVKPAPVATKAPASPGRLVQLVEPPRKRPEVAASVPVAPIPVATIAASPRPEPVVVCSQDVRPQMGPPPIAEPASIVFAELDAMRSIAGALIGLDRNAARRAIRWIDERFALGLIAPSPSASPADPPHPEDDEERP